MGYEITELQGDFTGTAQVKNDFLTEELFIKVGKEKLHVKNDIARVEHKGNSEQSSTSIGKTALRTGLASLAGHHYNNNNAMAGALGSLAASVSVQNTHTSVYIIVTLKDHRVFAGKTTVKAFNALVAASPQLTNEQLKEHEKMQAMLNEAELVIPEVEDEIKQLCATQTKLKNKVKAAKKFDERYQLNEELELIKIKIEQKEELLTKLNCHQNIETAPKHAAEDIHKLMPILMGNILLPFLIIVILAVVFNDNKDSVLLICIVIYLALCMTWGTIKFALTCTKKVALKLKVKKI